jgi:deferrochelatase/peroxidase EfeB
VAFNAVRHLAKLGEGAVRLRWTQAGFLPNSKANETPRNLLGFKDGTESPLRASATGPAAPDQVVWVGTGAPGWMQGGSYMVVRRIRLALEHWDKMDVADQQQIVGREKRSGAPLGGKAEFDAMNLDATDGDGNAVIPDTAHIRMATAASNGGARLLRRSSSYNDGANVTAERWPPWHQGLEYDAGLLFVSYQQDPRTSFIKIFGKMSKLDMLNQFATHTASGLFACPGGAARGTFIGQSLFT